jgi:hypothetical protein
MTSRRTLFKGSAMKRIISFLLIAIAAEGLAAKIEVSFPDAAEREVWVVCEMPTRMPVAGRAFETKTIPVEIEDPRAYVIVHEPGTGGVAIKQASSITGVWNVEKGDWKAAKVVIEAFSRGNPVAAGEVEVRGSKYEETSPIASGKAIFFAVPYDDVEVTLKYKSGGADKASEPQTFRVRKEPDGKPSEFAVTITEAVDTGATAEKPKQPEPSWLARSIVWIVGLGIAAAALVFLMKFLMGRSDQVEQKLRDLGVPVPGDLASAPADDVVGAKPFEPEPVVPAGHCPYCGKEQADCVCRLDAPKVSPTGHEPEFVGLGVELRIPEGESVVGREGELVVSDPTVSRQHAKITRDGNSITVEDLGSSNGTFVDGVRIEAPTEVKPGASVHFGSIKVRLEG